MLKKPKKIIYIPIICVIIIIAIVLLVIHSTIPSKHSIASYSDYHAPIVRLDKNVDPGYSYRFHPQNKFYLRKSVIMQRHRVPRYFFHIGKYRLLSEYITVWHRQIAYLPIKYKITPLHDHTIEYVQHNFPIWSSPYTPGVPWVSTTNGLANVQQAVKIHQVAQSDHHVFYQIASGGHVYGWVPKDALKKSNMYQMPFHYYSQLQPYNAPDACEAVSLRMALSVKGCDPRMSMKKFIKLVPRNKNPEKGYNHNPLKLGDHAAIFPKALAKYARKYDKHAYAYTGIGKKRLIYEIKRGNPVVFEGSYRMKDIDSDHTLVLVGYSQGYLKFADPYYKKGWHKPISWVSIHKFTKLFHQPLRGARAVVIR